MHTLFSFAFIAGSLLMLTACTIQPSFTSQEKNISSVTPYSSYTYTIRKGDSLSLIAKRYGTTVADIAIANGLHPPYTIYPGQRLQINVSNTISAPAAPLPSQASNQTMPTSTTMRQVRRMPNTVNIATPAPNQIKRCYPPVTWQRPTTAHRVVKTPSYTGEGVATFLFGTMGQAVRAASSGKVVYSGPSPNGYYPNLIIIQHNEAFLSTYGYNRRRLVEVGERVIAGQKIAEMGVTPKNEAALYFEIRCHSKAVDPLAYLPKY